MGIAGRAYILSASIVLVAMADRVGWINWSGVGQVAAIVLFVAVGIVAVLVLIALMVGLPLLLVTAITVGLLKLCPKRHAVAPSA